MTRITVHVALALAAVLFTLAAWSAPGLHRAGGYVLTAIIVLFWLFFVTVYEANRRR